MATNIIIRGIDEGLHKALKIRSINENVTLQDLIKKILAESVKKSK